LGAEVVLVGHGIGGSLWRRIKKEEELAGRKTIESNPSV